MCYRQLPSVEVVGVVVVLLAVVVVAIVALVVVVVAEEAVSVVPDVVFSVLNKCFCNKYSIQ